MTRRRASLVAAGAAALLARAAPAAADCLPAAELSGDPDVAAEVALALAQLGIVHGEADGACPPVAAAVRHDPAGIAVSIRDARGRIEGRVVAEPRTAAAWIESWARDDAAPLWAGPPVVALPAAPHAPPSSVPAAPGGADLVPPAPAPASPRAGAGARLVPAVAVHLGRDLAADGSAWATAGAAACLRVGPTCLGVAARHARNDAFSHTDGLTAYDRASTVVAATAALRVPVARVVLAPELAVGAGVTTTRRHEPLDVCVQPDGQLCDGPLYVGDGFAARTWAPRAAAALGAAVPLGGWLWLDARAGVELAPGAHTAPHRVTPPGANEPTDPMTPVPPGDPLLDLPGEPGWAWTAAIGLRVEVP